MATHVASVLPCQGCCTGQAGSHRSVKEQEGRAQRRRSQMHGKVDQDKTCPKHIYIHIFNFYLFLFLYLYINLFPWKASLAFRCWSRGWMGDQSTDPGHSKPPLCAHLAAAGGQLGPRCCPSPRSQPGRRPRSSEPTLAPADSVCLHGQGRRFPPSQTSLKSEGEHLQEAPAGFKACKTGTFPLFRKPVI